MIKTAPNPPQAARRIVKVLDSPNPKLFNQVDFQSKFFLALNRFMPRNIRDMLVNSVMNIKP